MTSSKARKKARKAKKAAKIKAAQEQRRLETLSNTSAAPTDSDPAAAAAQAKEEARKQRKQKQLKQQRKAQRRRKAIRRTNRAPMVWVDLEMTGLDLEKHRIIEMACIVTDAQLNVLGTSETIVIHQSEEVLADMNEWCVETFAKTGLTEQVRASKVTTRECEQHMLEFVKQFTEPGKSPLCGNSVHCDRMFLHKEMPEFLEHLHYRIVDVSTIKELAWRWYPEIAAMAPKKKLVHRALDDIQESIEELQFYRKALFPPHFEDSSEGEEEEEEEEEV